MELSNRLSKIIELCDSGDCVADIGCDHAYVSTGLVKNGSYKRAIACDINKGPLLSAKKCISENKLDDYIETRLSNGLSNIHAHEADTIVIAGMGGSLIKNIMDNGLDVLKTAKRIVLGPQSEIAELRLYLYSTGFSVSDECYIYDEDKYYQLIVCSYSGVIKKDIPEEYLSFGEKAIISRDPVLREFLLWRLSVLDKLISGLQLQFEAVTNNDKKTRLEQRITEIKNESGLLEKALKLVS